MMDLSHEDKLRMNVLLAQSPEAIRIDESRMEVHALSQQGEAKVTLHANCKDEKYIKIVRQWLSSHVLGSPGGYPVYLRRWTRMGQARDDSLQKLLLLGEPEAIVATVRASGLTDELARRAWWCSPNSDNARAMLQNKTVAQGAIGRELANFLVEFLPFEESSRAMIHSVKSVLQANLIDEKTKLDIWKRGKRRNTFYVGFLQQCPDDLPLDIPAHKKYSDFSNATKTLADSMMLNKLERVLSTKGQAAIELFITLLSKPNDQDVTVEIFNTLHTYFFIDECHPKNWRDITELNSYVDQYIQSPASEIEDIIHAYPESKEYIRHLISLSMVSETLLDPVFGVTDAIGSVMRKRIAHLTEPLLQQLKCLQ